MLASIGDAISRDKLKADVLNQPAWEESILFACERLARGDPKQQEACAAAILAAFEVDPILAAEMIFRSTDAVWARVGSTIQGLIGRWHTPGKVDRALRFMISSGRPEFRRSGLAAHHARERSSASLGAPRWQALPAIPSRKRCGQADCCVIVRRSEKRPARDRVQQWDGWPRPRGRIAKDDPDPEVKATVVDAFAFRRADRHVADVLRCADEKTFDLVARDGLVDDVDR